MRIYQHSNLLYWWVVWVYGFICAALTYAQGIGVPQLAASGGQGDPVPRLAVARLSFIALILFVVVFTNVRARGVYSFVSAAVGGAGSAGASTYVPGIDTAMSWASLLRIHLNLAFYLTFSVLLMLIWLFVTVVRRPLHLVAVLAGAGDRGAPRRPGDGPRLQHGRHGGAAPARRFLPPSLGLGLSGSAPAISSSSRRYSDTFEIHNVWKANRKQRMMERMVAIRITEVGAARNPDAQLWPCIPSAAAKLICGCEARRS